MIASPSSAMRATASRPSSAGSRIARAPLARDGPGGGGAGLLRSPPMSRSPALRRSAPPPPRDSARCRASLLDRFAALFSPSPSAPSSSASLRPTPAAVAAAARIVELAEATDRGTATSPSARRELLALATQLRDTEAALCTGSSAAAKQAITGTWRQLFSTEKETLFIFSKIAPLFGVKGEEAYQVIDAEAGRLQNVITFSNGARFVVESALEVEAVQEGEEAEGEEEEAARRGKRGGARKAGRGKASSSSSSSPLPLRCRFQFTGAALKLPSGRTINLPPTGKGWFDTTYVDANARVAFDVRGDTLVVARDGPVRWF